MNKRVKKALSLICAITMVVTSVTGFQVTSIIADSVTTLIKTSDTEARATLLAEVADADYNFALGKEASVSNLTTTDGGTDLSIITNGTFTTNDAKSNIIEIGRGSGDLQWVQIDLEKAYDTSKIDRIAVQYKTNGTSPRSGYKISYSFNRLDFIDVATIGKNSGSGNQIFLDKITLTTEQQNKIPYAKFVRVTSTNNSDTNSYGMQIKGMAVLTDGTTKVSEVEYQEVETLDDPVSLTVTSNDYEQLEYSFEASANDTGDYTYYAYINGNKVEGTVEPNTKYTVTGLSAGEYEVVIMSTKDGLFSNGITQKIVVLDIKSLLTTERNIAIGKTATASSLRTEDGNTRLAFVTDTILTGKDDKLFRTNTADKAASVVIDLGNYYGLDTFERVVGLYKASRYPKSYSIEYSINNTDFEKVAEATGSSELQTVEIDASGCTLPAVRYVRFNLSEPVAANYGFQMFELGVIAKEGADLTPVEITEVANPADFAVEVMGYNTVKATITAGDNQENYKYNVYLDGNIFETNLDAGSYIFENIDAGQREFTVKSSVDGVLSEGISRIVTVENPFEYTYETLAAGTAQAGKILDETKIVGDVTYYNYAWHPSTIATSSSVQDNNLVANMAIDKPTVQTVEDVDTLVDTTRWASEQGVDLQYIVIDLRNTYKIDVIDIVWQNSSAKDFNIQISNDGVVFEKVGLVSSAKTGSRYDNIVLNDEIEARYVKIEGTARNTDYGYSIWGLGIYGPEEDKTIYHEVSIDGAETTSVAEGDTFTLSTEATYGYYCDGKMYKPGAKVTVASDMAFTSVKNLSVSISKGAGIRIDGTSGIRFKATVTTDNTAALESNAITEGMLITTSDIRDGKALGIDSDYTKVNVVNSGWYNNEVGSYCGSVINIAESNYAREFVARSYVIINYEDGTSRVEYSENHSEDRSIAQIAKAIQDSEEYGSLTGTPKKWVDIYATKYVA